MRYPNIVYGYHGTFGDAAKEIIEKGFMPSECEWDWLGDGAYFWQDAPLRALEWAKRWFSFHPVVIKAAINLEGCMDLLDIGWNDILQTRYMKYKEYNDEFDRIISLEKINRGKGLHYLDNVIIKATIADYENISGEKIQSVRGAFREGQPVYAGFHLFDRSHVQICVRDLASILECEIIERARR